MLNPTLGSLYLQALQQNPSAIAIVDGDEHLTFAELARRVALLLALFDSQGYRPGHRIAAAIPMSADFIVCYIASQIGGLAFCDLPPSLPLDVLLHRLETGRFETVILSPAAFGAEAPSVAAAMSVEVLTTSPLSGYKDLPGLLGGLEPAPLSLRRTGEFAIICFTGGSTGPPKAEGITGEAGAALAMIILAAARFPYKPVMIAYRTGYQVLQAGLTQTLMRGGKVVTIPDFDLDQINAEGRRHGANLLFLATRSIYTLAEQQDVDWMPGQIELIFHGGEPIAPARLREAVERFGQVFFALYGAAEIGPAVALLPLDHDLCRPNLLLSAGRPMPAIQVEIRDSDGNAVGPGGVGEVAIRSPAQMTCYIDQPEATAKTIRDGWVFTGDVGRVDEEGYLYILDRVAFAFNSEGSVVYPRLIDAYLMGHPSVSIAVTVGVADSASTHLTCTAVILRPESTVGEKDLIDFLVNCPGTPKVHHIVFIESLPQNPAHLKVDRAKVVELVRAAISLRAVAQ